MSLLTGGITNRAVCFFYPEVVYLWPEETTLLLGTTMPLVLFLLLAGVSLFWVDCYCLGYPWNLKESSSLKQLSINQLVALDLLKSFVLVVLQKPQAQVMYQQVKLGASMLS